MANLKVLIIGAGLGGLTLAQSLHGAGIDVHVYERDATPRDRPQGYRLHLDADGINAAHEVLPPALRAVFTATSQQTEPFTTILGTDLSVIKRLPTDAEHDQGVWPAQEGPPRHCNVDRATLREILLSGLMDRVHFSKRVVRHETHDHGVTAHFDDSTCAEGDVLVGADGIRSVVRAQRAPHARTMDAGVLAIYGRVPMSTAEALVPPATLQDIFTIASDERKVFMGLGSVRFPKRQDPYVACIVGGRPEYFPAGAAHMRDAAGAQLRQIATEVLSAWPERARNLVGRGDPSAFFLVEMHTSIPCTLDMPYNVTLLGDAIHAMTPTLGRGANVAMRDGALLGRALKSVARDGVGLGRALADYERNMLSYGFDVVREAARTGGERMAQNALTAGEDCR